MSRRSGVIGPLALITLGLLAAVAPFSTDLYLAAFPVMTADLSTTAAGVQLSLTTFLIGAGLGQVLFGPWSDRAGRMTPLVVGLGVYAIASIATAIAPTIEIFVIARLLQGIGGSAGMVIGRAMILDRDTGSRAASALNVMMAMSGIAPIVAPLVGALLVEPIGWRGIQWVIVGIAVVALVATALVLRETLPASTRSERRSRNVRGAGRSLLRAEYLGNAISFAFAMAVLMAYISASPFVYQTVLGMSEIGYGFAFAANAIGVTVATLLSSRLSLVFSLRRLAGTAIGLSIAGTAGSLALAGLGVEGWPLIAALFVAVAPLGLVLGNVSALAMSSVSAEATGLASAVLGLLQFALAGVVAALVGLGGEHSALPMAIVMLAYGAVSALSMRVGRGRGRESGPAVGDAALAASRNDTGMLQTV